MQKAIDENPTYVLFNGSEGALTGDKALTGEGRRDGSGSTSATAAPTSSFHVIGEIFDKVWSEGGTEFQENVQTTLIPAGGRRWSSSPWSAGHLRPGRPQLFRAFNKGAIGMLKVDGSGDKSIYSGKEVDSVYLADKAVTPGAGAPVAGCGRRVRATKEQQIEAGKVAVPGTCSTCHQADGKGCPGCSRRSPARTSSMADPRRAASASW
jgi:nitrite reductase (NO-forming)